MQDNSNFKILIVDDLALNIEIAANYLKDEGYTLSSVTSGVGALKAAFSKKFDLILLDINMPEMDGYEVCRRLKNDAETKNIPIIFLSALNDIDAITTAFEVGGVDYISKPFNGLELLARVKTQVTLRSYIQEIEEKQSKLAQLAATDSLTGLSNKLRFMSVLKKEVASLSAQNLSLAYISIDHMHKINNMFGYKAGDQVLLKIARIVKDEVRSRDTVARLFGSEFVILMPHTTFDMAKKQIQKIHHTINNIKSNSLKITCSFGLGAYKNDATHEAFIMRCEKMMEEAKASGGNKIVAKP